MYRFLKAIPLIILAVIMVAAPYIAPVFGLSVIVASIAGWGYGVGWATTYAICGWILYAVFTVLTPWLVASFTYKLGPIGEVSFHEHFKKAVWPDLVTLLFSTILWPVGWLALDRFAQNWGMCGFDAVLSNTWEYWTKDRHHGPRVEVLLVLLVPRASRATAANPAEGVIPEADEAAQEDSDHL